MIHVIKFQKGMSFGERVVYIGRAMPHLGLEASVLGNPFHIGVDGSREEVIRKYRAQLATFIRMGHPMILAELRRLRSLAQSGDLWLVCWCAPQACHGHVLKAALEQAPAA